MPQCVGGGVGPAAVPGMATLWCIVKHTPFRLDFVAIGCARQRVVERFHPKITR